MQIVNGDIYINDKIQRKPDSIQETLWLPVYNSRYSTKEEAIPIWVTDSNAWTIHKDSLTLNNTSQGSSDPSLVTLGRRILDHNGYNNRAGSNEMGDIKISFDVTPLKGSKSLEIVLEKNNDIFTAVIPTNDTNAKSYLKKGGNVLVEDNVHIQTGQKHNIALSNVDSIVSLSIDNKKSLYSTMMTGR